MRYCKVSDFQKRKLLGDEQSLNYLTSRLCPDFDGFDKSKKLFKLKNGYGNVTERYSFSAEIHLNGEANLTANQSQFISDISVSFFVLHQTAELGN